MAYVRAQIRKDVDEVYEEYLTSPDRKVRAEGASRMLEEGKAPNNSMDQRYVLLVCSRDLAERAGDQHSACAAIDALAANFRVDPLHLKFESAKKVAAERLCPAEVTVRLFLEIGRGYVARGTDAANAQKCHDHARLNAKRHSRSPAIYKALTAEAERLEEAIGILIEHTDREGRASAAFQRQPIPPLSDRNIAREQLSTGFGLDDVGHLSKRAALQIANELLRSAKRPTNNASHRYVCLSESMAIAERHGDMGSLLPAIDEMALQFQLARHQLKYDAAERMVEGACPCPAASLTRLYLAASIGASEDLGLARRALTKAQANQIRLRGTLEGRKLAALCETAELELQTAERIASLKAAVAKDPEDREALRDLGWLYCVRRDDWKAGLPLLAKANIWPTGVLALQELAHEISPEEGMEIADQWWALAHDKGKQLELDAIARAAVKRHAQDWYAKVVADITDFRARKIEKRLSDMAGHDPRVTPEPTATAGPSRPANPPRRAKPVIIADAQVKGSINLALEWLSAHQDEAGKWDCDGFMKHDSADSEICNGPGNASYDVGITGLALLAFLGKGHSEDTGAYQHNVTKCIRWLCQQQQPNGLLGTNAKHDFIYNHAIATYALCKALAHSDDEQLRSSAQEGINYLEMHRNPRSVWRYQPRNNDNDISITGWAIAAYTQGKLSGLRIDDSHLLLAESFLDQVSDKTGKHGYTKQGEGSSRKPGEHGRKFPIKYGAALTAVGLSCRWMLGQSPTSHPRMAAARDLLNKLPPAWHDRSGTIDHYYWYQGAKALRGGGKQWLKTWRGPLRSAALKHQHSDGDNLKGSWDPVGVWGEDGGRVYSTAMMCLALIEAFR
jgi:hypothetical protein